VVFVPAEACRSSCSQNYILIGIYNRNSFTVKTEKVCKEGDNMGKSESESDLKGKEIRSVTKVKGKTLKLQRTLLCQPIHIFFSRHFLLFFARLAGSAWAQVHRDSQNG